MTAKPSTAKRKSGNGILLRYRDTDSGYGVTRKTALAMADTLGLSETQVVHVALANLARQTLPRYEADGGPLTPTQKNEIRRMQRPGRMKSRDSLF
jgi:hypothetical protein